MRLTFVAILIIYAMMNASIAFMGGVEMLGSLEKPPFRSPDELKLQFMSINITSGDLLFGGATIGTGVIAGLYLSAPIWAGGAFGLLLFGLSKLFPFISDLITGVPQFLTMLGLASEFIFLFEIMMAVITLVFLLNLFFPRGIEF